MKNKDEVIYSAWLQNSSGATVNAGKSTNLNKLKTEIRKSYGPGWTAHIDKYINDDLRGEVEKFTLRK